MTSIGSFKISDAPTTPSALPPESKQDDETESALHHGEPLLLAIPMNPHTLFVCWNVDWPVVFGNARPVDRKAYIKVEDGDSERIYAVEPLAGSCSIAELESGQIYTVELGYFAPADKWNVVVARQEVMMSGPSQTNGDVEAVTVPFHLAFQKLIDLLGVESEVVQALAKFEAGAAEKLIAGATMEKLMRALGLSMNDLAATVATWKELTKIRSRPSPVSEGFGSSNWSGGGS